MSHPEPLSQWMETVSSMFPKLSRPQAKVLAYWSYGMVLARSCGITLVCAALALQVDSSEQSLLQRLREWCYGAEDKKGKKRRELDVSSLEALPQTHVARRTATQRSRPRMLSCFARGIITIVGMLIRGDGLVPGRFVPEPWPTMPSVPKKKTTKTKARMAQEAA
jgi:hypothetical protein